MTGCPNVHRNQEKIFQIAPRTFISLFGTHTKKNFNFTRYFCLFIVVVGHTAQRSFIVQHDFIPFCFSDLNSKLCSLTVGPMSKSTITAISTKTFYQLKTNNNKKHRKINKITLKTMESQMPKALKSTYMKIK